MHNIILSGGLAFLITFFSIPVIIEVAKDKKLFDMPGGRKVHDAVIPTLGGLGIFAGFIIAMLIGVPPSEASVLQYFIAAIMIIFFMGIKDDILILTATKKFVGQLIAAAILIKFAGIRITDMYGMMGINTLSPTVSFLITLFTIVVITNSFNLIDGVDGLAGSLGLLTSITFGGYFYLSGQVMYSVIALSLTGSLIAFLIYNFNPAKIFMGDTGSLLIGLINSILVIKFINIASGPASAFPLQSAPAIGFSILLVPLFDTLRVVSHRILSRRSPFSPDRNHIHHFLLDLGLNHKKVAFTCVTANILFIIIAYFLRASGSSIVMLILIGGATFLVSIIYFFKSKRKIVVINGQLDAKPLIKTQNIIRVLRETIQQD
ncbi:MAG TPA: MraY family glycosyltransferase [Hanamia sp.]|jgi:UDP-GlcNAc:undecaprenyl-phosphate/decaprenyl-phosphate GlcNAc-1-phosphate transferase|nr:MraY family glycosyltransferase [Hanamia sp.]